MFTYCRRDPRNTTSDTFSAAVTTYHYGVNSNTQPMYCPSLNVPNLANKGLPRALLDVEENLRGLDRGSQSYCVNEVGMQKVNSDTKPDVTSFSFDYMRQTPTIPLVPPPMAPSSLLTRTLPRRVYER